MSRMVVKIVVGVDGSDGALAALRWALDEAGLRGAAVDVVHAWHYPYVGGDVMGMYAIDEAELAKVAHDLVDRAVAAAAPVPDGVVVHRKVPRGGEATALLDAAKDADILVVGSRGRGGFSGLLLGSVSQQCIHHAPCPVVVVPSPNRS